MMRLEQIAFRVMRFDFDLSRVEGLASNMRQQKLNGLINRFYRELHIVPPTHIDQTPELMDQFVNFLCDSVAPTVSTNTFKIYRNSCLPIIPYPDLASKLRNVSGVHSKNRKSSRQPKRQKHLQSHQLNTIVEYNNEYRTRSTYAKVCNILLQAGVVVGLRPGEWYDSMLRHCEGRLTLIVRTEKLYREKLENIQRGSNEDLSLFLPYRGIPLDHLDEHQVGIVRSACRMMKDVKDSEQDNDKFIKETADCLTDTITQIWGRLNKPGINLYSARHQFIANLKASNIEDRTVTYLAGQLYDGTKHRHYAGKRRGERSAVPTNVDHIQSFIQKNINSKFKSSD